MQRIIEYVRDGGGLTEDELAALIHERMLRIPVRTQRNWLRQLVLAMDGYGLPHHLAAADRVKTVVRRLDAELAANAPGATAPDAGPPNT
jgi:hypothetical protein